MPSASVRTTVIVSPLAPASERSAYFTSRQKTPIASRKLNCSVLIPVMTVPPLSRLRHSDVVRHRAFSTAGPKKSGAHGVSFRNHTRCRLPMFHSPYKLRGIMRDVTIVSHRFLNTSHRRRARLISITCRWRNAIELVQSCCDLLETRWAEVRDALPD